MVLTGETEVLGEKHYTVWVVDGWMSMEQWWNGTDGGILKYWEKNIIQRGWQMDEWVWSNGGMILTGENRIVMSIRPSQILHKLNWV